DLEPKRARGLLRSLRFSNRDTDWIVHIVTCWHQLHDDIAAALNADEPVSDPRLRRWVAVCGRTVFRDFSRVAYARWLADRAFGRPAPEPRRAARAFRRGLRLAFRDPVALADLAVDGEDLVAAGIPPGPRVGAVLRALLDFVVEDPARNRRDLLLDH